MVSLKAICLAGFLVVAVAQDWAQWRGPKRDGIAHGLSEPKAWPEQLMLKWKMNVGGRHGVTRDS